MHSVPRGGMEGGEGLSLGNGTRSRRDEEGGALAETLLPSSGAGRRRASGYDHQNEGGGGWQYLHDITNQTRLHNKNLKGGEGWDGDRVLRIRLWIVRSL